MGLMSVGKGNLLHAVFWPPLSHRRMDLGPVTLPYQEIKSPHSLCWTCHLMWEYLSLFQTQCVLPLFCLSMCVTCGTWPTPLPYLSSSGKKQGLSATAQEECVQTECCWERPAGHGRPMPTTEADLALSLPCVSKALFYPVLAWFVFSLVTPIPRCSGQKSLNFYRW